MINQDAVHGQLSPFVHKWLIFRAVQAGVPASYNEALIALQPSDLEQPELGTLWANIGDVVRNGTLVYLSLNCSRHDVWYCGRDSDPDRGA